MITSFKNFINSNDLCAPHDTILVTVSGGVDSMVLVDLFLKLNYTIALAHCNFNLREDASELDEKLVQKIATEKQLPFHVKRFDTIEYAKKNKLSIEMAARELRYSWFNQLVKEHNYNYIATGHHSNDAIETLFLNLCRGTGFNGITGIPEKNNNIIRPLLFSSRTQIEQYAKNNNIEYRYDCSNDSVKYMRNIVRHQVIPSLRKINPSFDNVMLQNINNFKESAQLYHNYIDLLKDKLLIQTKDNIRIAIEELKKQTPLRTCLFELLKDYNFNNDTVVGIIKNIDSQSGKFFLSNTHRLLIDRDYLIIEEISINETTNISFNSIESLIGSKYFDTVTLVSNNNLKIIKDPNIALIDSDKLSFPLTIQNWQNGDVFQPLGMNNFKKVSDFLIDNKVNRLIKKNVLTLKSNNDIVWIIGYRLDNRFKVTSKTENVLILN